MVTVARFVLAMVLGLSAGGLARADPPAERVEAETSPAASAEAPRDEDILRWLTELGADSFETREKATEQLAKAGAAAVPGLAALIRDGKLEPAVRALKALRTIYETGEGSSFDAAELVLEQTAIGPNKALARRAQIALAAQDSARQRRAISRIEELGGEVRVAAPTGQAIFVNGVIMQDDAPRVEQILLGDDWKGGDAGLSYVRRLPPSVRIALYVTPSCGISQQALDDLRSARTDIDIQTRGSAMLGISCETADGMLTVMRVQEGSGAAEAGLQVDDVIEKFEGMEIRDFQVIIDAIRSRKVGDKLTLEVSRDGMTSTKSVTLGKWTLKDLKR